MTSQAPPLPQRCAKGKEYVVYDSMQARAGRLEQLFCLGFGFGEVSEVLNCVAESLELLSKSVSCPWFLSYRIV